MITAAFNSSVAFLAFTANGVGLACEKGWGSAPHWSGVALLAAKRRLPGHADRAAAGTGMWQKALVLSSRKAAQLYVHFNSLRGKAVPPVGGGGTGFPIPQKTGGIMKGQYLPSFDLSTSFRCLDLLY